MTDLIKKKILLVLRSLNMGGAEKQALHLALHLKSKESALVEVLSFFKGGRLYQNYIDAGIRVIYKNPGISKNPFKRAVDLLLFLLTLRRLKPDIILPYTDFPNKVCGAIWKFSGAKTCIWNQRDAGIEVTGKFLEKRAISSTPWFVSNSKTGIEFLRNRFKVNHKRISLIYNGIKLPQPLKPASQWRKDLKIKKNTFIVIMLANIQRNKDHQTLISAWSNFLKTVNEGNNPPLLLLAGKLYPQSWDVIDFITKTGVRDQVRLLGEVKDITGLLNISQLAVYSSKTEASPNGVLECMAAGLPVIATDLPGIREVLGKDYPFYAKSNDPVQFSDLITRLFKDHKLQNKYGRLNRKRIDDMFSLELMCSSYSSLLIDLLNKSE